MQVCIVFNALQFSLLGLIIMQLYLSSPIITNRITDKNHSGFKNLRLTHPFLTEYRSILKYLFHTIKVWATPYGATLTRLSISISVELGIYEPSFNLQYATTMSPT